MSEVDVQLLFVYIRYSTTLPERTVSTVELRMAEDLDDRLRRFHNAGSNIINQGGPFNIGSQQNNLFVGDCALREKQLS